MDEERKELQEYKALLSSNLTLKGRRVGGVVGGGHELKEKFT